MRLRACIVLALAGMAASACAPEEPRFSWPIAPGFPIAHSVPLGPRVDGLGADCHVDFERMTRREAEERGEEAGVICVNVSDAESLDKLYAPGLAHDAARKEACALGAAFVIPIGLCDYRPGYGIELGAYRARAAR